MPKNLAILSYSYEPLEIQNNAHFILVPIKRFKRLPSEWSPLEPHAALAEKQECTSVINGSYAELNVLSNFWV